MKKLHRIWGDEVQFIDVVVRQAHPGPRVPPYRSFGEKMDDAVAYKEEDRIPWPVLVDDLEGSVHQTYGGLADPTYLIDTDGRVAYYNMWTYAPALHEAIDALLFQGGRGVVKGGWDRLVRLGPPMTDGWRGIRRGLPQSYTDLMTAAPGSATGMWLGHQLRPLLAPLTLRAEPLPTSAKIGLLVGATALAALVIARQRDDYERLEPVREYWRARVH